MNFRRFICVALALTFVLALAAPIAEAAVAVKSITLDVTKLTLELDQTPRRLQVTFKPANATNKNVTFKSGKPTVATVDASGTITPVSVGKTMITATSKSGKKTAKCEVIVVRSKADLVTYRVFSIANSNYRAPNSQLPFCASDQNLVRVAFSNAMFGGMNLGMARHETNLTSSEMRKLLQDMANCGADSNDVTVFYYSGHGLLDNANYQQSPNNGALVGVNNYPTTSDSIVTVNQVRSYLDKVPGTVIVVLDSCLSGQFIDDRGLTSRSTGTTQSFNQSVINAFAPSSESTANGKSLTDPPSGNKYKIITAARPYESSYEVELKKGGGFGVFTYWMGKGIGCAYAKKPVKTKLVADTNGNKVVTLAELYNYVDKNVRQMTRNYRISQTTMVWPANDQTAVIARTPYGS